MTSFVARFFAMMIVLMLSLLFPLMQVVAAAADDDFHDTCGTAHDCDNNEDAQKDYYEKASHYDILWGTDNMHFGYYPHLVPQHDTRIKLSPAQASLALTEHMMKLANIQQTDHVLDLGSGKGLTCLDIASSTGASCTGIDLTPSNVERAKTLAASNPNFHLEFHQGSFTALPDAITDKGPYDVVFSQDSFCHAHGELDEIVTQVLRVLKADGGRLVVSDFLGAGDAADVDGNGALSIHPDTIQHVYKRLHFTKLHNHTSWRRVVDGFPQLELLHYENMDRHVRQFYVDLAVEARRHDYVSTDGTISLGESCDQTAMAVERNEIGMHIALYERRCGN